MDEIVDRTSGLACRFIEAAGWRHIGSELCALRSGEYGASLFLIVLLAVAVWAAVRALGAFITVR
jgi:hypothetical protein